MKILIVERDTEEMKGIEWYLKTYFSEQVVIQTSTSTEELDALIVSFQPKVIIMETELMTAHNQAILTKHRKHVIAITSSPIFQQAVRAIEVRALQLFIKPIPLEKLKSTLLSLPDALTSSEKATLPHYETKLYDYLYLNVLPTEDMREYSFIVMEPEEERFNLELYNWFISMPIFQQFKAVPLRSRIVAFVKTDDLSHVEKQLRIVMQEWHAVSGKDVNIAIYTGQSEVIIDMYESCKGALSQRFYKGYGQIFKSDSPLTIARFDPLLSPEQQQLWITSLESGDLKQIKQFLYRLTNPEHYYHYEDTRIHLTSILAQIRRYMRKYQLHEDEALELKYRELFHFILQHPILYTIVQEFILFIQLLMENVKESAYQRQIDYVEMAMQLIEKHYNDPQLSLHSVAGELNISTNYLSNIFSKKRGIPFKKYLQQYRLQQSERLVVETRMTITEVANEVGFIDSNYFTKVFKEHYRLTPLKYRVQKQKS